jgi:hypothetical protein
VYFLILDLEEVQVKHPDAIANRTHDLMSVRCLFHLEDQALPPDRQKPWGRDGRDQSRSIDLQVCDEMLRFQMGMGHTLPKEPLYLHLPDPKPEEDDLTEPSEKTHVGRRYPVFRLLLGIRDDSAEIAPGSDGNLPLLDQSLDRVFAHQVSLREDSQH